MDKIEIIDVAEPSQVKTRFKAAMEGWKGLLPEDLKSLILIKPNFNSNYNALTGNTTDMRLISALIEFLKDAGYSRLIIADGPSGGFDRAGVSVIKRLKADRLASNYNAEIADLNNWPSTIDVPLENGKITEVADILDKADYIINIAKLKTHCETGMSGCLKNLIGTCVGIENKRKIHAHLAKNILLLNQRIRPDLHIVDGLIAMEGNGPSRGSPINLGKILVGTNPYQVDYISARLVNFPVDSLTIVSEAIRLGFIGGKDIREWNSMKFEKWQLMIRPPKVNPVVAFVTNPLWQNHLARIRNAPGVKNVCSTNIVKQIFYLIGISQERIRQSDPDLYFELDSRCCNRCMKCVDYCPMDQSFDDIANGGGEECIGCLYCFSVCPNSAIQIKGELGYFADQIRLYDGLIRSVT